MLGDLTKKLQDTFNKLTGKLRLSEENIADAVRDVRMALLEADVSYAVTKVLIKRIKEKAIGEKFIKSVEPGQQFIKIVHDELIVLMGSDEVSLDLESDLPVVLICGLQGSGKTTFSVKLAKYLKKEKKAKKPLILACDLQRPAAVEQLITLGKQINVPVFSMKDEKNPVTVAKKGLEQAKKDEHDLLIVDTAGRLHVDEALMQQLREIKSVVSPDNILFVANAVTGQDAVNTASVFNKEMEITGSVLTMLDGNTRGGAAISIREVTEKPLLFEGIGEKVDDVQLFNPRSMADRILGMGDTINLVKRAKEVISEEDSKKMEEKLRKATFSYQDYLSQIQSVKKMGSISSFLSMMPGAGQFKGMDIDEKEFMRTEAIILSMTPAERCEDCDLSAGRRRRIASGSGTTSGEVNKLIKNFKRAKSFFKNMPNMKQLEKMVKGGSLWR